MAKVLAQLSSFFRVWPIPLHNTQPLTVEQLLSVKDRGKVYSSLCTLSLGLEQML